MSKIQYEDKERLQDDPSILEINKVTDDNMNEIKEVVNANDDHIIIDDTVPEELDNVQIFINNGELPVIGSEVVNSLDGDETDKSPSVNAVNEGLASIIESGSNTNGNWIKFVDGTMICYKTLTGTIDVNNAWGTNFYISQDIDIGATPMTFISNPIINITARNTGASQFMIVGANEENAYGNINSFGKMALARPTTRTGLAYIINVTAIGRWK